MVFSKWRQGRVYCTEQWHYRVSMLKPNHKHTDGLTIRVYFICSYMLMLINYIATDFHF